MEELIPTLFIIAIAIFFYHMDKKYKSTMDESNDGWGSFDPRDGPDGGGF